ncbi:MAG: DNA-binding protein [Actinobacteria bacterium]|nr:MAG: DNA-binding protein [Actinomycetota bacterium]
MNLPQWSQEGRLRPHRPTSSERAALLEAVGRDLDDAANLGISADRRFATAYSAALMLASLALHAAGYRAAGPGHHETTMRSLPLVMGPEQLERSRYLDACRIKRNHVDYDGMGYATHAEADELIDEVVLLLDDVLAWLAAEHPELGV